MAFKLEQSIEIDGLLRETAWQGEGYGNFTQSDPKDGALPSENSRVWVAYNDDALYIAARLEDTQPQKITKRLGRRDDFVDSDWFILSIDPYFDRRSGYKFAVNPAGSICDWALHNDVWEDPTWDGVWDWAARIHEQGWNVEIKIPYHQLRFPKKENYTWGINFQRIIKRKNEKDGFVWIPKEENGFVSRFALLEGIRGIHPGRHIEISPYTVVKIHSSPAEPDNPFRTGTSLDGNLGFDLKAGLKTNFTLDATINPDFGQVEVDPAVVNLTAFETYYQEKRPFFIEGANIFRFGEGGVNSLSAVNWQNPIFFYSRRIGRPPQGNTLRTGFTDFPDRTTIVGAFKLAGKLAQEWNVGFISALTSREYATILNLEDRIQEEVEPLSYYGAFRAQKEFLQGRHGLGFITTAVLRDPRTDSLSNILPEQSFSLAVDGWTSIDADRKWVVSGWLGGTYVTGSRSAILRLQQSSLHYFQRPDATHLELDPQATSLSGWAGRISLNKQRGNIIFNSAFGMISPGFDVNDMGFQLLWSDVINAHIVFGYQWFHPGKVFRNASIALAPYITSDFGPNLSDSGLIAMINGQFLNYWGFQTITGLSVKNWDRNLTRGGPLAEKPALVTFRTTLYSDNRQPVVFLMSSEYTTMTNRSHLWNQNLSLEWKPSSNFSLSIGPQYGYNRIVTQWVTRIDDPVMTETYGARYVFAELNQRTIAAEIRLDWIFTPWLSLQLYMQPFLSSGKYAAFKELARPRSYDFSVYGGGDSTIEFGGGVYTVDPDAEGPATEFSFYDPAFNVKSLRGTVVLRWEYLPGSTLFFVWTQNRANYLHPGDFDFGRDLGDLLTAPGDNIFLIKISYRWSL
ncbi:MAG: carbohydrate binding family 9 domain-containing protein [Candidatus Aminicenantes bacterium]|nr:carbohydrate binding family 9 domain-containing protein [Candidatus Aminicenantes bacterium]